MRNELMDSLYIALADAEHINVNAEFKKLSDAEKKIFLKKLNWLLSETSYEEG